MRRAFVSALLVGALSGPAFAQTTGPDSGGLLQMLFSGAAREPAVERPYQPMPQYPTYPAGYQQGAVPQGGYAPVQPPQIVYQPAPVQQQVIYQPAPAPQVVYQSAPEQRQVMYQPAPAPQAVYQPAPVQQQVVYQPAPAPRAVYQPAPAQPQVVYQPAPAPQPAYEPNYAAIPMPQVGYQPLPPPPPPVVQQPGYVAVPVQQGGYQPLMAYAPPSRGDAARMPIDPKFERQTVDYKTDEKPGTIVIDTPNHFLYLVEADGKALRYGIGVGRPGFTWQGVKTVTAKKEWPDWTPPADMLQRRPDLPRYMAGGPDNPLGARAMYLGSTLHRIHGSNEPWTIGTDVSSGCIRLRNADVIDLYDRVKVGAKVVVI